MSMAGLMDLLEVFEKAPRRAGFSVSVDINRLPK